MEYITVGIFLVPGMGVRNQFIALSEIEENGDVFRLGQTDRVPAMPLYIATIEKENLPKVKADLITKFCDYERLTLGYEKRYAARVNENRILYGFQYEVSKKLLDIQEKATHLLSFYSNNCEVDWVFDEEILLEGMRSLCQGFKSDSDRGQFCPFVSISDSRFDDISIEHQTIVFEEIKLASIGNYLSCRKVFETLRLN